MSSHSSPRFASLGFNTEITVRKLGVATKILGLTILLAACPAPKLPTANSSLLDPDGEFTLYVTNQSYAINNADIHVEIDGELVVSDTFDVGTQHNFVPFALALTKGSHTIHAWSESGDVDLASDFELKDEDVGVVMFWHDPDSVANPNRYINFNLQEGPLLIY